MHDSLLASFGGDRELALRKFIQAYLASVAAVDELVGQVLDALEQTGLDDETVVVFTSDHGWGMGEKGYFYKNSLWQESTRVPLIIRAPKITKAGARCDHPVSLIDVYPTLLDICGLPEDTVKDETKGEPLDGHSLVPLLRNSEGKWAGPEAALTALYVWADDYDPGKQSYSLRAKDWRYIRYANGKEELYQTESDPHEWTNLAGNPEHGTTLKRFRSQLLAIIPEPRPEPTPEQSAARWKESYVKKHPNADTDGDGVLSWPELKAHKAKAEKKSEPKR